jgi:staphylococcal nuclease domain-containing protein 1
LVGKEVKFSVQYTVATITLPRENGTVLLPGVNVLETAVSEGWVKLREGGGRKEKSEEEETILARLKELEEQAKTAGKGIWGGQERGRADVSQSVGGQEKKFLEQWKGKDIDGMLTSELH